MVTTNIGGTSNPTILGRIAERVTDLRNVHAQNADTWAERKRLRRGIKKNSPSEEKLRTNDSVVLFNFALHLISSRDIRWHLPSVSKDAEKEIEKNGNAEKILSSIFYQNNVSRSQRGLPRCERAIADSALEQAKVVIYKERRGDEFRIDPVDPTTVFERTDESGLVELVHEFSVSDVWLEDQRGKTDYWILPDDHGIKGRVNIYDYWRKNPAGQWANTVVVLSTSNRFQSLGNNGQIALQRTVDENPWEVQYFAGEAFSDASTKYKGNGLLDVNSRVYDDYDSFLEKLILHMDEVLTSPANASTRGGRPIDPDYVDPSKGTRPIYTSDAAMGESNISFSQIPGLDQSTGLILESLNQFVQQGGVNRLFLGNLDFQLSGFAISRFQELTLASIGEVVVGLEFLWSRIGYWVLSSLKNSPPSEQQSRTFTGFTSSLANRGYFSDSFNIPNDLPRDINVAAKVDVAMPNDLTERISQARQLNPSPDALWSPRNVSEILFPREIPDVQGNLNEIREQTVGQLPQVQLLEVFAGLVSRLEKEKASPDADDIVINVLEQEIQAIREAVSTQANNQRPGVTGGFNQQTQPAEARGEGRAR